MLVADSGVVIGHLILPFDGFHPESPQFLISGNGKHFTVFAPLPYAEWDEASTVPHYYDYLSI